MSILASILGSATIIEKGIDLIDEAFDSTEEKAEAEATVVKAKTKAKTDLLSAYAPFKVAQRYLALIFTLLFAFIMINGILGALYGWVNLNNVNQALQFANKMWLGEIMLAIISFYFGGGFIESINRKETHGK